MGTREVREEVAQRLAGVRGSAGRVEEAYEALSEHPRCEHISAFSDDDEELGQFGCGARFYARPYLKAHRVSTGQYACQKPRCRAYMPTNT